MRKTLLAVALSLMTFVPMRAWAQSCGTPTLLFNTVPQTYGFVGYNSGWTEANGDPTLGETFKISVTGYSCDLNPSFSVPGLQIKSQGTTYVRFYLRQNEGAYRETHITIAGADFLLKQESHPTTAYTVVHQGESINVALGSIADGGT